MSRRRRTVMTDRDHRPKVRFYCPVCGEVRGNPIWSDSTTEHNGQFTYCNGQRVVTGSMVYPHFRPFFLGTDKCPGGPIDPVEDRAP